MHTKPPALTNPVELFHSHTKKYAFVYNEMAKNVNCLAQGCQTFLPPEHHWGKRNKIILFFEEKVKEKYIDGGNISQHN